MHDGAVPLDLVAEHETSEASQSSLHVQVYVDVFVVTDDSYHSEHKFEVGALE